MSKLEFPWTFTSEWGSLPCSNLFDRDHRPTRDMSRAAICVARLPSGRWLSAVCCPLEISLRGIDMTLAVMRSLYLSTP